MEEELERSGLGKYSALTGQRVLVRTVTQGDATLALGWTSSALQAQPGNAALEEWTSSFSECSAETTLALKLSLDEFLRDSLC